MVYLLLFKHQMYINMHEDSQWKLALPLKLMSSVQTQTDFTFHPIVSLVHVRVIAMVT